MAINGNRSWRLQLEPMLHIDEKSLVVFSTWGEFGDDVFIALFSGLFDRSTAKATASPFPRILGLVGSVGTHVCVVRRTEPIASCVVIVRIHAQSYYLDYLSSVSQPSCKPASYLRSLYVIIQLYWWRVTK